MHILVEEEPLLPKKWGRKRKQKLSRNLPTQGALVLLPGVMISRSLYFPHLKAPAIISQYTSK